MIEPAFWSLAKKSIKDARVSSEERTAKALANAKSSEGEGGAGKKVAGDDTPVATVDQLVGMECVRFQGLRVAYFAVDKESELACLKEAEGVEAGRREGDKLILNRIVSLKGMATKKAI